MNRFEKIPRLARLTAILLKLQSKRTVSIASLAGTFEVSTRTIYRDLGALEEAGVPIVNVEGQRVALIEGYTIPPVMFSESEANALIMAEKIIGRSKDESFISEFTNAIDKIKSVLRHSMKDKSDFLLERTIIGTNWKDERTSSWLPQIQGALTNFKVLNISYQKANNPTTTERQIEPFAIYRNTEDNWVVIAWCRLRKEFRNFRMDRIKQLQMLDENFTPHKMTMEEYVEWQREIYENRNSGN